MILVQKAKRQHAYTFFIGKVLVERENGRKWQTRYESGRRDIASATFSNTLPSKFRDSGNVLKGMKFCKGYPLYSILCYIARGKGNP